jgi:hypothetical protein
MKNLVPALNHFGCIAVSSLLFPLLWASTSEDFPVRYFLYDWDIFVQLMGIGGGGALIGSILTSIIVFRKNPQRQAPLTSFYLPIIAAFAVVGVLVVTTPFALWVDITLEKLFLLGFLPETLSLIPPLYLAQRFGRGLVFR